MRIIRWLATTHRAAFVISRRRRLGVTVNFHALTLQLFAIRFLELSRWGWAFAVAVPFVDIWIGQVKDEEGEVG